MTLPISMILEDVIMINILNVFSLYMLPYRKKELL